MSVVIQAYNRAAVIAVAVSHGREMFCRKHQQKLISQLSWQDRAARIKHDVEAWLRPRSEPSA